MNQGKILVIDDEENMTWLFKQVFSKEYDITGVTDVAAGLSYLNREPFDLLMLDLKMPKIDGLQALKLIHHSHPELPVIIMTAYASVRTAVEAMKLGATDYIMKPFNTRELRKLIHGVMLKRQARRLDRANGGQEEIVSKFITINQEMISKLEIIPKVANTDASVLIEGESGTGKELIANEIHNNSQRRNQAFISVNCAAIPENLMEAELFGYEKGAFTGAYGRKEGLFETANGGTLFLDEIGDLPLSLQAKLLRVLEEKKIARLGGTKKIPVDVRIISATNKDLWDEVKKGNFREDLYFRLAIISVNLPPIRKRPEDIDFLAKFFLSCYSTKYDKTFKEIEAQAMNCLLSYSWPGNVRELKNFIERIVILENDEILRYKYLPDHLKNHYNSGKDSASDRSNARDASKPLKEEVAQLQGRLEREMIMQALKKFNGNRTKAAQALQISRRCLQIKIKNFNIVDI